VTDALGKPVTVEIESTPDTVDAVDPEASLREVQRPTK